MHKLETTQRFRELERKAKHGRALLFDKETAQRVRMSQLAQASERPIVIEVDATVPLRHYLYMLRA